MVSPNTIVFWGILGGLSLLCVIAIIIIYFICYSRNPRQCLHNEHEDLLETTIHQEEVHTSVTHVTGDTSKEPTIQHRTEQIHTVITKQKSKGRLFQPHSTEPVKICVTPQQVETHVDPKCSSRSRSTCEQGRYSKQSLQQSGARQKHVTSIGDIS